MLWMRFPHIRFWKRLAEFHETQYKFYVNGETLRSIVVQFHTVYNNNITDIRIRKTVAVLQYFTFGKVGLCNFKIVIL